MLNEKKVTFVGYLGKVRVTADMTTNGSRYEINLHHTYGRDPSWRGESIKLVGDTASASHSVQNWTNRSLAASRPCNETWMMPYAFAHIHDYIEFSVGSTITRQIHVNKEHQFITNLDLSMYEVLAAACLDRYDNSEGFNVFKAINFDSERNAIINDRKVQAFAKSEGSYGYLPVFTIDTSELSCDDGLLEFTQHGALTLMGEYFKSIAHALGTLSNHQLREVDRADSAAWAVACYWGILATERKTLLTSCRLADSKKVELYCNTTIPVACKLGIDMVSAIQTNEDHGYCTTNYNFDDFRGSDKSKFFVSGGITHLPFGIAYWLRTDQLSLAIKQAILKYLRAPQPDNSWSE